MRICFLAIGLAVISWPTTEVIAEPASDALPTTLRSTLVAKLQSFRVGDAEPADVVTVNLEASAAYAANGLNDQAEASFRQAYDTALQNDFKKHQFRLFAHAKQHEMWDFATRVADQSTQKNRFLDQMAIGRFKAGDDEALKGFPRSELDFYLAIELANAYAEREQLEQLETFVRGISSLPSNEPTDVGAIVWERLALQASARGDLAMAQSFIDQAMDIGGNNFYTGFSVRVTHDRLYGKLKQTAKKHAKRAVAYRGHFTRELLAQLTEQMVAAGLIEEAIKTLDFYPNDEERASGMTSLAYDLAEHGETAQSMELVKGIEDDGEAIRARVLVAKLLADQQRTTLATELALEAKQRLFKPGQTRKSYQLRRLAGVLARLGESEPCMDVIESGEDEVARIRLVAAALEACGQ